MKTPAGSKTRNTGATKDNVATKKSDQAETGLMTAVARQVGRTAGTIVKAAQGLAGKERPRSSNRPTVTASGKSQVSTKETTTEKAASSPARRRRKRSSAAARTKAGSRVKGK